MTRLAAAIVATLVSWVAVTVGAGLCLVGGLCMFGGGVLTARAAAMRAATK